MPQGEILRRIADFCLQQENRADELLGRLEEAGWPDKRPKRQKARKEERSVFPKIELTEAVNVPATAAIPSDWVQEYHTWYSGAIALVEANMPSRALELRSLHEGRGTSRDSALPMIKMLDSDRMTFEDQIEMATRIRQMRSVVASIPAYMEARLQDVELAVAQAYVSDELTEAELLLKSGFVRAAGAVAGVILERHLKLLCDRHQPVIKYGKTVGISQLNDKLRQADLYDVPQWRKVQWMGDVRNRCDHASSTDPRKDDVKDLIQEVRKFVSLVVL